MGDRGYFAQEGAATVGCNNTIGGDAVVTKVSGGGGRRRSGLGDEREGVAVLTYDVPHQKTYDLLTLLKARGYRDVRVYGTDMRYQKRFHPLIEHRPELTTDLSPGELCRNLGFPYERLSYEQIDLEAGSLVLVAGAGLLPEAFVGRYRVVNAHPGYIPNCRGLDALKWAIYEGQPIGVTTHLIGREVDAGEVIERRTVPVYRGDTFHRLCERVYHTEIAMLADAVEKVVGGHGYISGEGYEVHRRMPHEYEAELLMRFEEMKNDRQEDLGGRHSC